MKWIGVRAKNLRMQTVALGLLNSLPGKKVCMEIKCLFFQSYF